MLSMITIQYFKAMEFRRYSLIAQICIRTNGSVEGNPLVDIVTGPLTTQSDRLITEAEVRSSDHHQFIGFMTMMIVSPLTLGSE